jgi:fucose permease
MGQGEEHYIELEQMSLPDSQSTHGFYLPTSEVRVRGRISEQVPTPHIGSTQHPKSLVDLTNRESLSPLLTVTILFFLWGFAYGLLGALNTKFQVLVNITKGETVAIHCVYFAAYFTGPPAFSYSVLTRFGFKITIIMGLCIFAVGSLVFWPSAILGSFAGFVVSNYIAALGLSTLEISANPFIALCGPPQHAEGRVNLAQAVRGVGSVTALLLANLVLFQQTSVSNLVDAQWTYLAIAIFSIALACFFYYYPLPEVTMNQLDKSWGLEEPLPRIRRLGLSMSVPTSVMVVAAISQCVSLGAQETVSPVTFTLMTHWLEHASSNQVFLLLAALDGMVVLGRVTAGVIFLITPVRPEQLLSVSTIGASVTCILSIFLNSKSVLGPFFLNYFFQSAIFPTIFVMALRSQGHRVHLSSAFQISSMVGGAIFPAVQYGVENITGTKGS